VIADPHLALDQHQKLTTSRGSPLAYAYHVWSTSVTTIVESSCSQTERQNEQMTQWQNELRQSWQSNDATTDAFSCEDKVNDLNNSIFCKIIITVLMNVSNKSPV